MERNWAMEVLVSRSVREIVGIGVARSSACGVRVCVEVFEAVDRGLRTEWMWTRDDTS